MKGLHLLLLLLGALAANASAKSYDSFQGYVVDEDQLQEDFTSKIQKRSSLVPKFVQDIQTGLDDIKTRQGNLENQFTELKNIILEGVTIPTNIPTITIEGIEDLSTQLRDSTAEIKTRMGLLPLKTDVEQMYEKMTVLLNAVASGGNDVGSDCENQGLLQELLTKAESTGGKVDKVASALKASVSTITNACSTCNADRDEAVSNIADGIQNLLTKADNGIQSVRLIDTRLQEVIGELEGQKETLQHLMNSSFIAPAPTPELEPDTGISTVPGPCLDSEFEVSASLISGSICATAVKWKMCNQEFLAYHCCRSCVDAALIEEDGPHRFLNYPRNVSTINAVRLMTHSLPQG